MIDPGSVAAANKKAIGTSEGPLLAVEDLTTAFFSRRGGGVIAVDGVSFEVQPGEAVGVVGESGSGKTVTMMSVLRLIPKMAGRIVEGRVLFGGRDLMTLPRRELADIRGRDIGMIFQDPMTSLNPVFKIGRQIAEPLVRHRGMSVRAARKRAVELMEAVEIPSAASRLDDYPHEFSGGMRQRVMIAMALSCNPKLLIADEPTTALDVTVQAKILDILNGLRRDLGMALILVTHDLGVVAGTADRVNVMYAGEIVETGSVSAVFNDPRHPYTRGLLDSIPRLRGSIRGGKLQTIPGRPPDLSNKPAGCAFFERCAFANSKAETERPELLPTESDPTHRVACWIDVLTPGTSTDPAGSRRQDTGIAERD